MSDPIVINPTLTLAGQAAAFNASSDGVELKITHVSFGRAHYDPDGDEVALTSPVGTKIPLAGGSRPTPYQIRMSVTWREDVGEVAIGEIGYWSGDTLVFIWSKADGTVASYKTDGVAYVLFNDLAFAQVPANSIDFVIDPNESVALAALSAHEGADNAHPQYLLRADVAKDSGPLALLTVTGTANALILTLKAAESELPALARGQRFQFLAAVANTGPVTANVEGLGAIAIKKAGDAGLVELDAGDIKAGALYDLNYDGTQFQLGGGVGGGKAFQRFSFTASVGQKEFTAAHTPGSLIVLRNGREVTGFVSAVDGTKITLATACAVGESVEILAFGSFKTADAYTKAEIIALLKTASGLPVGAMLPFPRGVVPAGFLEVDGSGFDATIYPDLAAYLGGNTLPESRGEFLRGWDHGRGIDVGRAIGSFQLDDFKSHSHGIPAQSAGASGSLTSTLGGNAIASTNAVGGNETRPRNLAVMWCIKAWNAPINQGQIDIAALAAQAAALALNGPLVGSARNARMIVSAAAGSASATFTANELIVKSALDGQSYHLTNFSKVIDLTLAGAGGMDVGATQANGFVGLYAIYNPVTKASALLGVNASTAVLPEVYQGANMPAGYTASALVSVWPTITAGLFAAGVQIDREVQHVSRAALSTSTPTTTPVSLLMSTLVPLNAKAAVVGVGVSQTSSGNGVGMSVSSSAAAVGPISANAAVSGQTSGSNTYGRILFTQQQTVYYYMFNTSPGGFTISVTGYSF